MKHEPAFPGPVYSTDTGLTKLEYFAIQMMPVLARINPTDTQKIIAKYAVDCAENLIQELERRGEK
jgi:hypothetical protein